MSFGSNTLKTTLSFLGTLAESLTSLRQRSQKFDSADRQVIPRHPTIPQHDRVGFVSVDAQDHAAPTSPNRLATAPLPKRGCGACGKLYPVPLLDQLQSLRGSHHS